MLKIKSETFVAALESAAVGGGKGFIVKVDPTKRKMGEREVQLAAVSSSDGDKTGAATVQVVTDAESAETYFCSANLKAAVTTLSKVADELVIDKKNSHLVIKAGKSATVKVELMETDVTMALPQSPEGAVMVTMTVESFKEAIRLGGYAAEDSNIAGIDTIAFRVDEENKKLLIISRRNVLMAKAEAPLQAVKNGAETAEWYLVNYKFIQAVVGKLSGKMVQVAFTPKTVVIQTQTGIFGCKRTDGTVTDGMVKIFDDKEYEYSGKVSKKDLSLAMEVAMVGVKEKSIALNTAEDGQLVVSAESNGSMVTQKEHTGKMGMKKFFPEVLKLVLASVGEELFYYGKGNPPFVRFSGTEKGVAYEGIMLPIEKKK